MSIFVKVYKFGSLPWSKFIVVINNNKESVTPWSRFFILDEQNYTSEDLNNQQQFGELSATGWNRRVSTNKATFLNKKIYIYNKSVTI